MEITPIYLYSAIMAVLLSTFQFIFANILLHLTIHTDHLAQVQKQVRINTLILHD